MLGTLAVYAATLLQLPAPTSLVSAGIVAAEAVEAGVTVALLQHLWLTARALLYVHSSCPQLADSTR